MKEIYLDYAAASPVRPEVVEAMLPYFTDISANPSSIHNAGQRARTAVETARTAIAKILHCSADEIVFTSGGTESINLAIQGFAHAHKHKGKHIITSTIEHEAVLKTCQALEQEGFEITYIPVDQFGLVNPHDVQAAIRPDTILISIMYANNEVGTIQPIAKIGAIAKQKNVCFHSDACQAGYLDLNVEKLNVDLMTLNSSKIYGPKGIGLLYKQRKVMLQPLIHGGGQEFQLRSGSENVPAIVGFAQALGLAQQERDQENSRLTTLRNAFIQKILTTIPGSVLNGHPTQRLANNVNISFPGIEGEQLLLYLNEFGIYVSSGSACTSHAIATSHVLQAIHLEENFARGAIRLTLGKDTSEQDLKYVLEILPAIIAALQTAQEVQ